MTTNLNKILTKSVQYLILTHVEPDFDAIGSMLGLTGSLELMGYSVTPLVESVPFFMQALPGVDKLKSQLPANASSYHVIALDSASRERVYQSDWLSSAGKIINIDHHQDNPHFGDINLINVNTSSTSEYLFHLLTRAHFPMDESVILPLYAGILYDTGGFRYSNTSPATLMTAGRMIKPYASEIPALSDMVFSRWNQDSFEALQHALASSEYWFGDKVCFSAVPYSISSQLPALAFEGMVDILRLHHCVKVIIFVREKEPGVWKGSLRSKPPMTVSSIAHTFNGGGHPRAAGFTVHGITLNKLKQQIKNLLQPDFAEKTER